MILHWSNDIGLPHFFFFNFPMADGDNFLWKIYGGSSRQGANVQILLRVLGGGGGVGGGGSQIHFPVI